MSVLVLGVLSLATFLMCADRLRVMHWRTIKPVFAGLHLAFTLWSIYVLFDCFDAKAEWGNALGLVGVACWLYITHKTWASGPPSYALRGVDNVDAPSTKSLR